jgi:hypothetical protein
VALGSGISILPEQAMQAEVEKRRLVSIPLRAPELVRPVGIIHRRWRDSRFVLISSEDQLEEFRRVTRYPRIQGRIESAHYSTSAAPLGDHAHSCHSFAEIWRNNMLSLKEEPHEKLFPGDYDFVSGRHGTGAYNARLRGNHFQRWNVQSFKLYDQLLSDEWRHRQHHAY